LRALQELKVRVPDTAFREVVGAGRRLGTVGEEEVVGNDPREKQPQEDEDERDKESDDERLAFSLAK
jgi:hypothetical protein